MLAKYFYPKYNNRFSIDPIERSRLEEYKRQYLDWREWNAYMPYNDQRQAQVPPDGADRLLLNLSEDAAARR